MLRYRKNNLCIDRIPVRKIVESAGTPVYVYSQTTFLKNFRAYRRAFHSVPHLICYALKANSNQTLLKLLAQAGSGADIVSGGELYRARKAGFPSERIVFAGVGKTETEIQTALRNGVLSLHVESEQELQLIDRIAAQLSCKAPISLRVNPDIQARTHPYISTGLRRHKFGIPLRKAVQIYRESAKWEHVRFEGIHMHLGSQIPGVRPFVEGTRRALEVIDGLRTEGIVLSHLDIGGGLAVGSEESSVSSPEELAKSILPLIRGRKLRLLLEPGRSIVASAGILVTRVLYTKEHHGKRFVIVDAGMNDFIRPSLYDAYHPIRPALLTARGETGQDIVGPVCESGDFFAKNRLLSRCEPGDLLVIENAGAYGFSMSSNYNSRPRPPEVLVTNGNFKMIRKRETFQDLIRAEVSR